MAYNCEYCLYIQKINNRFNDSDIITILERFNIGKISKIEHIKCDKYLSVFVYFEFISWNSSTMEILTSIESGHSYKLATDKLATDKLATDKLATDKLAYWIIRKRPMIGVAQLLLQKINMLEDIVEKQNTIIQSHEQIINLRFYSEKKESNFFYISDSSTSSYDSLCDLL